MELFEIGIRPSINKQFDQDFPNYQSWIWVVNVPKEIAF